MCLFVEFYPFKKINLRKTGHGVANQYPKFHLGSILINPLIIKSHAIAWLGSIWIL